MIALLLMLSLPVQDGTQTIHVDAIERNVVINRDGQKTIDQYILKRWHKNKFQIAQWWLANGRDRVRNNDGTYEIRAYRGMVEYRIVTRSYRETTTSYDPELRDRDKLPIDQRRPYLIDEVCEQ